MNDKPERKTKTVEEFAAIVGMGRSSAYEAVRSGQIPATKIGRRYFIANTTIDRITGEKQ